MPPLSSQVILVGPFSAAVDTIYDGTPMTRVNLFNIEIRSALANCARMEAADSQVHLLLGNVTCNEEYLPCHLYRQRNRSITRERTLFLYCPKRECPHLLAVTSTRGKESRRINGAHTWRDRGIFICAIIRYNRREVRSFARGDNFFLPPSLGRPRRYRSRVLDARLFVEFIIL